MKNNLKLSNKIDETDIYSEFEHLEEDSDSSDENQIGNKKEKKNFQEEYDDLVILRNKESELLKQIRLLVVAYDNMGEDAKEKLTTAAEVLANLDVLIEVGQVCLSAERSRRQQAPRPLRPSQYGAHDIPLVVDGSLVPMNGSSPNQNNNLPSSSSTTTTSVISTTIDFLECNPKCFHMTPGRKVRHFSGRKKSVIFWCSGLLKE